MIINIQPGKDEIRHQETVPSCVLKEPVGSAAVIDKDHHDNTDPGWYVPNDPYVTMENWFS